jgi:hypothetical protein
MAYKTGYVVARVPDDTASLNSKNETRESVSVLRNIEARSCGQFCSGKAISILHTKFVSVALGIQLPMRMSHIVLCGLPSGTIFSHFMPYDTFFGKKRYCTLNVCRDLVYNFCLKRFSF